MRHLCLLGLLTTLLMGCGAAGGKTPAVFPVEGTLTFNGQPLAGAYIAFEADDNGRGAFATSNDEGQFKLTTYASNDGGRAGTYKVLVTMTLPPTPTPDQPITDETAYVPPVEPAEGDEAPKSSAATRESISAKSILPERYASGRTSGLTAEVKATGKNQFQFDLVTE